MCGVGGRGRFVNSWDRPKICYLPRFELHYRVFVRAGSILWIVDRVYMITVVKQDPYGNAKAQYQGEIVRHLPQGIVIQAYWTRAAKDLGYTVFEPGDRFIEYYYTRRWFNIFAIENRNGTRKGWYCNI